MKKYYPASPIVFFVDGLCVFVIVGAICAVVGTFIEKDEPWEICCIIIVAIIMIPLMGSGIAGLAWKRILLTPENISVRNDFQRPFFISRVQHAVTVSYSEVTELWYTKTTTDSNGNPLKWVFIEMPYLIFECKGGVQKAINLHYFSKRQRKKIINEVICRVKQAGNSLKVSSAEELMKNCS